MLMVSVVPMVPMSSVIVYGAWCLRCLWWSMVPVVSMVPMDTMSIGMKWSRVLITQTPRERSTTT